MEALYIATDGYLCDPLSIASGGYLSVVVEVEDNISKPSIVFEDEKSSGSGYSYTEKLKKDKQRSREEEEIIFMMKVITEICL
jgi:hypothetical protein